MKLTIALALAALLSLPYGGRAAVAQDFAPQFEAVPLFDKCGDGSYERAVKDGIALGISPSPPYSSIDPNTKRAAGLDVEINEGALHWMGVKTIKYEVAPFGQLIPMLLSKRIDHMNDQMRRYDHAMIDFILEMLQQKNVNPVVLPSGMTRQQAVEQIYKNDLSPELEEALARIKKFVARHKK